MSLSASQINSQITAENFIKSTNDESFTLTLNHDGIKKAYTIKIDANNRVVSATRIEPGTSTWDKLKTALANFFGTSNNARIVKGMNKLPNNTIESIKKNAIERHNTNELALQHNKYVNDKIKGLVIKADDCNFDPLNIKDDKAYADYIYSTATSEEKWGVLSDYILFRPKNTALIGSAIRFGDKEFFDRMLVQVNIEPDSEKVLLKTINAFLNISGGENLKKLANYINDNFDNNSENIKDFCKAIGDQARTNLKNAGADTWKVSTKY